MLSIRKPKATQLANTNRYFESIERHPLDIHSNEHLLYRIEDLIMP
jgi:hypothetical protein